MKWAYGVTTVPSRKDTLLPQTLDSLNKAGFLKPRLFVDGCNSPGQYYKHTDSHYVTTRTTPIGAYGNWVLALWELYIRQTADRYVMFQDDVIICPGTRDYLEECPWPGKCYLNLYTHVENDKLATSKGLTYPTWFESNQLGRGALALVFDAGFLSDLFQQQYFVDHPRSGRKNMVNIDGVVSRAAKNLQVTEYVHHPSLTQHLGLRSSIGKRVHPVSPSFPGEDYNIFEEYRKCKLLSLPDKNSENVEQNDTLGTT